MVPKKDIVFLVADKNMETTVSTLLTRQGSLDIRVITCDIFIHQYRDTGVLNNSHDFLRPFQNKYKYAMVLLDREGCGDNRERKVIEETVENFLNSSGWQGRCATIVFDPELEIWVWSDSPHVAKALGWEQTEINSWLQQKKFCSLGNQKPTRPKEAMEEALREKKIPRSSYIYKEIASQVSLKNCSDPSFLKFREVLQRWFK